MTSTAGSELGKRTGVTHPLGKSDVTLFHGTDKEKDADSLKSNIKLSAIKIGDLHDVEFGTINVQIKSVHQSLHLLVGHISQRALTERSI